MYPSHLPLCPGLDATHATGEREGRGEGREGEEREGKGRGGEGRGGEGRGGEGRGVSLSHLPYSTLLFITGTKHTSQEEEDAHSATHTVESSSGELVLNMRVNFGC